MLIFHLIQVLALVLQEHLSCCLSSCGSFWPKDPLALSFRSCPYCCWLLLFRHFAVQRPVLSSSVHHQHRLSYPPSENRSLGGLNCSQGPLREVFFRRCSDRICLTGLAVAVFHADQLYIEEYPFCFCLLGCFPPRWAIRAPEFMCLAQNLLREVLWVMWEVRLDSLNNQF